jgi:hypothetical protein
VNESGESGVAVLLCEGCQKCWSVRLERVPGAAPCKNIHIKNVEFYLVVSDKGAQ